MSEEATSYWQGFKNLRYLVVFGASYCDVGYKPNAHTHPSEELPLGVVYPGNTYAEPGQPNWVGYLATEFAPNAPRPLVVFDYGKGGSTVKDVAGQVKEQFTSDIDDKPEWANWTSSNTLFATWVGINDCATHTRTEDIDKTLQTLFEQQEVLYEKGARTFLFIDIPPMERAPVWPDDRTTGISIIKHWNQTLRDKAAHFSATHPGTTAFVWSSYELFNKILDDPKKYGLLEEDRKKMNGSIWYDHIHPSTKVHREIARDMADLLGGRAIGKL